MIMEQSVVWVLLSCLLWDTTTGCLEADAPDIRCLVSGVNSLSFTCPVGTKLKFTSVKYNILKSLDCPTSAPGTDDYCHLFDLLTYTEERCTDSPDSSCTVNVAKKAGIVGSCTGQHYIVSDYECEDQSHPTVPSLSMCEEESVTASEVVLTSHSSPPPFVSSLPCYCEVTLPLNIQLQVNSLELNLTHPSPQCSRSIVVSTADDERRYCEDGWQGQDSSLCDTDQTQIKVFYDAPDENAGVAFSMELKVHRTQTITVQCGLDMRNQTTTTLTQQTTTYGPQPTVDNNQPTTTVQDQTTTVEDQTTSDVTDTGGQEAAQVGSGIESSQIIAIIVGSCIIAFVALLLAVVFMIRRKRGSQMDDETSLDRTESESNFTFVKSVYVTGSESSRQMVSRKGIFGSAPLE